MSKLERKASDILSDVSLMAGDARSILAMADQTQETAELHPAIGAAIRVAIDYLQRIERLADSLDAPEQAAER